MKNEKIDYSQLVVPNEIDNFIGVFHNVLTKEECDEIISQFEYRVKAGLSYDRTGDPSHKRDDESLCELRDTPYIPEHIMAKLNDQIWNNCHPLYVQKYSILKDAAPYTIFDFKIQRTEPGQGYHVWHYESMKRPETSRLLVYTLYLNDVEEGGETEFLYANRRVKPTAGTFVLFPAGFTHTHRGNPPLSGTKYMLTGWLEH